MKRKILFVSFFLIAIVVFILHYWIVGSGVWGDGRYYYSWLRSLVIDRNLDLRNELNYFKEPLTFTPKGLVANKYNIGPAIFWLPGFLIAHLIVHGDGFSHLYQILVGVISVFWGILGIWLCFQTLSSFFSFSSAILAIFGGWLGTNLFFYTAIDPINSHSSSFLIACLILWYWKDLNYSSRPWKFFVLGGLIGILGMIRTQDLIFFLPFILWLIKEKIEVKKILNFILGIGMAFLPQILLWVKIYGKPWSPYLIEEEKFYFLNPKFFRVYFGEKNGLFYYSPILLLGFLGMLISFKKEWWAKIGIILFFLETYIISSWHSWYGGQAYGGRMFISVIPFFILGLGVIWERTKKTSYINFILVALVIIYNFYSIIKFLFVNP